MSHTDPNPPRCEHGAPWDRCPRCAAEIAEAERRAADALAQARNLSEAEKAALREQINSVTPRWPWQK